MNQAKNPARILVVDDEDRNRRLLVAMLEAEGYSAAEAADGAQALELARQSPPDIILLDIMMPGMDGYEVARALKTDAATKAIPVVMVTALDDRDSRLRGLEAGAEEFITKPVDRNELRIRVRNLLRLKEFSDFLADHNRILDTQVKQRTRQLLASYRETIATMTRAASYKDEETGAHVSRISFYSVELAQALGLDADFCDVIHYASPMHDVGKIAIPDAILGKPGKFEPHEWEIMKSHAGLGGKLLRGTDSPYLVMGAEIADGHHERWDGGGYPAGLAGDAIPLSARIMNICDQYDALRSKRPYKPAFSHERTLEIITVGDGRTLPAHFDPAVLEAFKGCVGRFRDIFEAHRDEG
ncbi:MAG: two-component system response regulator [Betaproteobacteria bacterium RIFCSPLOWO2_02_FULL_66_14]|nr:MAG: two-component system response regulator [Betaproteobacteria bacterium RIFCSPLOWO2_02_FULL_66_14]